MGGGDSAVHRDYYPARCSARMGCLRSASLHGIVLASWGGAMLEGAFHDFKPYWSPTLISCFEMIFIRQWVERCEVGLFWVGW
jgi:hypothetical protein